MNTLLLALQLAVIPPAQDGGADNRWARPLRFAPVAQPALVAVELDAHAFRFAKPDQSDIRVKTVAGAPESLLIRRPTQNRSRLVPADFQADTVSAGPVAGGAFSLVIRLRPGQPRPNSLRIVTPLRDFEKRVVVEGLGAEGKAVTLAEGIIADYSSLADFRADSIPLDPGQHRQFRVTIENPTDRQESAFRELVRRAGKPQWERLQVTTRPFRVDRVEFSGFTEVSEGEPAIWDRVAPGGLTITQDPMARETLYQFDTGMRPLLGVELTGTEGNFRRSVRLEIPEKVRGALVWKTVTSGVFSRFSFQGDTRESTQLTFPEARHGTMRLVVSNLDSPPIQATGLRLLAARVEVLFMATPGQSYRLEYGDTRARPPAFDTSAIDSALALGMAPAPATLGQALSLEAQEPPAEKEDPGVEFHHAHDPEIDAPTNPFFRPWVFGMVLLVLGAILLVSLAQAAAKMDANQPEQSPAKNKEE